MVGTFNTPSPKDDAFIKAVGEIIGETLFWKSEENKYVSGDSLMANAENVTLTMTREQFEKLFNAQLL